MFRGEAPPDIPEVGEQIADYKLESPLGAGAQCRVFLGTHAVLGRKAAIKVLSPELAHEDEVVRRLLREARVVNDIRHPNIVDITDFVTTDTPRRVALIMEYIEGPSLVALREKPVSFGQAVAIGLQLVDAIRAAHSAGVIHRDLKPANLLLTKAPWEAPDFVPQLKVVDFGLAKQSSRPFSPATGSMLGTPSYMAPEQITADPPPSSATDVYAIAEVLYELLAHRSVFPLDNVGAVVRMKLRGEPPTLDPIAGPHSKRLNSLVERSLSVAPEHRPALSEVRRELIEVCPATILKIGTGTWGLNAEDELEETLPAEGIRAHVAEDLTSGIPTAETEIASLRKPKPSS